MTERDIQKYLYTEFLGKYKYMFINTYLYNWESDFLGIDENHFSHEFEIKISKSDFKADFKHKTAKHLLLKTGNIDNKYTVATYGLKEVHNLRRRPNYFSYVVPENLIDPKDVPKYAGLYYVSKKGEINLIKAGKRMQCNKVGSNKFYKLLVSTYYKFWNNQFK